MNFFWITFIAFIGFVVSEDFCDTFVNKGNRISYLFKQCIENRYPSISTYHIIIDGHYWNMDFFAGNNTIEFNPNSNGSSAPLFSDRYFGAACLWTAVTDDGKNPIMLFPKNAFYIQKVNYTAIRDKDFNQIGNLSDYKSIKEYSTQMPDYTRPPQNYAFAYEPNAHNRTDLIDFAIGSGKEFKHERILLIKQKFEQKFVIFIQRTHESPEEPRYKNFADFKMSHEVIGIHSQWSKKDNYFGFVVLMRDGKRVLWCWRDQRFHNCNQTETLVDCSGYVATTEPPDPPEDNTLTIVIIAVICLILLAAIISTVVIIRRKKRDDMEVSSRTSKTSVSRKTKSRATGSKLKSSQLSKQFKT